MRISNENRPFCYEHHTNLNYNECYYLLLKINNKQINKQDTGNESCIILVLL